MEHVISLITLTKPLWAPVSMILGTAFVAGKALTIYKANQKEMLNTIQALSVKLDASDTKYKKALFEADETTLRFTKSEQCEHRHEMLLQEINKSNIPIITSIRDLCGDMKNVMVQIAKTTAIQHEHAKQITVILERMHTERDGSFKSRTTD